MPINRLTPEALAANGARRGPGDERVESDPSPAAVVWRGPGSRVFCQTDEGAGGGHGELHVRRGRRRRRRRAVIRQLLTGAVLVAIALAIWLWSLPEGMRALTEPERPGPMLAEQQEEPTEDAVPLAVVVDVPEPQPGESSEPAASSGVSLEDEVLTPIDGAQRTQPVVAKRKQHVDQNEPRAPITLIAKAPQPSPETGDTEGGAKDSSLDGRVAAALGRYRDGQRIAARTELNRLLTQIRNAQQQRELRSHLEKIADETVFSSKIFADDPLIERYAVESGDVLVHIGRKFSVPYEIIMRINGIRDARRIRAGQVLKVPRGPFHAVIDKSDFRLDLYLQDLYVRSFRVGLGADYGTPEGVWVVKEGERLRNPTYYPPPGSPIKRILPPNDPKNPLGEYWIALKGIEGDAIGRDGYGIHGTIEPDSIGRNASLGCVRMLNEEVAFLFDALMPGESRVTIRP
jgi:LysM repeat protein